MSGERLAWVLAGLVVALGLGFVLGLARPRGTRRSDPDAPPPGQADDDYPGPGPVAGSNGTAGR